MDEKIAKYGLSKTQIYDKFLECEPIYRKIGMDDEECYDSIHTDIQAFIHIENSKSTKVKKEHKELIIDIDDFKFTITFDKKYKIKVKMWISFTHVRNH